MEKNHQFIIELCRFFEPDKELLSFFIKDDPDWPYMLGQLLYNRLGSIAYYVFRETELLDALPREFKNTLETVYSCCCDKTNSMAVALDYLNILLKDAAFPYALLKGAHLISKYPSGLRTSNDIDILIPSGKLTQIEEILLAEGFKQGYLRNGNIIAATREEILSARMNRGETVPFFKTVNMPQMRYLEVDINFSLDFKAKQNSDVVAQIFRHVSEKSVLSGLSLRTLSDTDFFIHLCAHLYKEATTFAWVEKGNDLLLYKFVDLYFLMSLWFSRKSFCKELTDRIIEYGLQNECYYALSNTAGLFQIHQLQLDELLDDIKPKNTTYLKTVKLPVQKKEYTYDIPFENWLFSTNRRKALHEFINGKP